MNRAPQKIVFFRPTLGEGGADRVTITLLRGLDRSLFKPSLVLVKRHGVWLEDVPKDVPIVDLGASRLRFSWLRLASMLRKERPDILLSTSSGGNLVAALAHWLVRDPHRRLVLSERNTFSIVREERRPRWFPVATITRHLYKKADKIVAVSNGVAADLVDSLQLPKDLVTAIHNPVVDEEILQLAEQDVDHPWLDGANPVVLAVGRLVAQKDYQLLLHAFSRVCQKRPVRLIILGEGEERGALEDLAAKLGISDKVDFPGFMKNPFPFMRRCTVYVLSSRFEGLPGALIQAMACGAPSVSTDCPSGPSEIIESGSSGILIPVGDEDALTSAIERLLDDPHLRERLSEGARNAARRFAASSMIRLYEAALTNSS